MSFSEEEKKKALQLHDETGSISKVIQKLGYPSRQNMYTWIKNRNIERKRRENDYTDSPDHRRHPSLETKLEIIHRCFEEGEEINQYLKNMDIRGKAFITGEKSIYPEVPVR